MRLSDDGAVRIWVSSPSHVVVDVAGAFVPAIESHAGRYVAIAARRLLDTRTSGTPDPGRPITVALPAEVPADALALAVNLTLTETTGFDFVAASAAGAAPPATSVLNADGAGQTRAAGAIVPVSPGGMALTVAFGSDVIVDVVGYFTGPSAASSGAGLFVAAVPRRVLDTRSSVPQLYDHGTREIDVTGVIGAPVAAVVANWTLTPTTRAGWVATFPSRTIHGEASTVNGDTAGQTVANRVLPPAVRPRAPR